ncbi:Betaine aldehyde dehydrogenase 2 [Cymbomonas tetramitiformis]|uniref:Betaine aldehyde dehydrogenase 2 n=1 Tax=Cymbomonas tetramitiformis TaxID=36881 RepID=A0AAE0KYV7_9CHLO|nr:Betaine aldehyde dehydrogenase 2 [Cymbomonas tetramitiformis]
MDTIPADCLKRSELYYGGKWSVPRSGGNLAVVNPHDEQVIGHIPAGDASDVDLAVAAARSSFENGAWSKISGEERSKVLLAIAEKIKDKAVKERLSILETLDSGKPFGESEWDMDDVAGCFEYYAGLAASSAAKTEVEVPDDTFKGCVKKEPLGVVALITPWNYPMLMATWKVAPALAAGCSVVLKPSEHASFTCLELAQIAHDAGLPPGVLNVITGTGVDAGAPLAEHPGIDKVAFTGSLATGRAVMTAAAKDVKACSLELGGKSPLIVFEDAEIPKAVEWAMFGAFWTNGQICSATSRLLIQESIAPKFLAMLKEMAEKVNVCNPLQADCRLGPIVTAAQYHKVLAMVNIAKEQGAKLLTGGGRPAGLASGYYIQPTVFTDVTTSMSIWKEEVFGPVLAVKTFATEEEAIALANDTQYGLAAAVISADEARLQSCTDALRCGIVWVNCSQPCFCQLPWGGLKRSGFGRDLGEGAIANYQNIKQVCTYTSSDQFGWYPSFAAKL